MPLEHILGTSPLILTLPYTGTSMQHLIERRLYDQDQFYGASDRFLDRLMGGLRDDLTVLRAKFHRYLSDVDYPFPSTELEAIRGMLGIVPLLTPEEEPIWSTPPSKKEAATWRSMYYATYHAALASSIARVRAQHGHAIVLNCRALSDEAMQRSKTSHADIWISTSLGAASAVGLTSRLVQLVKSTDRYSCALGRSSSTGWTARHYGRKGMGVLAIDLQINEACYLTTSDDAALYNSESADDLRVLLREMIDMIAEWRPD